MGEFTFTWKREGKGGKPWSMSFKDKTRAHHFEYEFRVRCEDDNNRVQMMGLCDEEGQETAHDYIQESWGFTDFQVRERHQIAVGIGPWEDVF